MGKKIRWVLINGLFVAAIYFGFEEGVETAESAAMFIAWLTIVSTLAFNAEVVKKEMRKVGRSVSPVIEGIFDISVTAALAFYGSWITAFFYLLHYILVQKAWEDLKADQEETSNP